MSFLFTPKTFFVWITFFFGAYLFEASNAIAADQHQLTQICGAANVSSTDPKLRVFYVYKFKHLMLSYKLLSVCICMECLPGFTGRCSFFVDAYTNYSLSLSLSLSVSFTRWAVGFCVLIIVPHKTSAHKIFSPQNKTDFM